MPLKTVEEAALRVKKGTRVLSLWAVVSDMWYQFLKTHGPIQIRVGSGPKQAGRNSHSGI